MGRGCGPGGWGSEFAAGEEEAVRASCVRGKMGAERRRDADSGRKRCRVPRAFSRGEEREDGRKGLAAEGGAYVTQGRVSTPASFRET